MQLSHLFVVLSGVATLSTAAPHKHSEASDEVAATQSSTAIDLLVSIKENWASIMSHNKPHFHHHPTPKKGSLPPIATHGHPSITARDTVVETASPSEKIDDRHRGVPTKLDPLFPKNIESQRTKIRVVPDRDDEPTLTKRDAAVEIGASSHGENDRLVAMYGLTKLKTITPVNCGDPRVGCVTKAYPAFDHGPPSTTFEMFHPTETDTFLGPWYIDHRRA